MLGPETENNRILQYQQFYSQLDSVSKVVVDYESFIENRSLYSGKVFEIEAYASKPNVFKKFEKGLLTSFSNSYSEKIKKRRDTLLDIKISSLKQQIIQVDSLQLVYLAVIREESKAPNVRFANGDTPLIQEKQKTKEFEILEKELKLRNDLRVLEEQRIEEAVFYDVISSFNEVGDKVESWKNKYMFIFPIIAFILVVIIFFAKIIVNFTLNYEK
jgi:gluconate kinase